MKKLTNFPYAHALVLGLAKSGTAAARLLLQNGIKVRVNDKQSSGNEEAVSELESMGAEVITGFHPLSVLDDIDIIVKNPGIPYENPLLTEAANRGIPIITEIEIAGNLVESSIIGITGSNGKTTTTTLITEMLRESNQPVQVAGNIGYVASEVAQTLKESEKMVLELSSFQLMGVQTFKPKIAVLLNIFEAHLDYHKTFENYKKAKCNIFANQSKDDNLVFNADDPVVSEAVLQASSYKIPFSMEKQLNDGAWIDDNNIYYGSEKIISRSEIVLVGSHNLQNILAAVCAAKLSGATTKGIREVLTTFSGVKHRTQYVENVAGRLFYNDSKATNILATQKALASFQQPVILLAGGLDRGNEFDDLLPYLNHVKGMILFGETTEKLEKLANQANIDFIQRAETMNEAVTYAFDHSEEGDVILMSPACASWDQYRSFEERGDMFIQAVHTL
ncbi:UDP-N-acetylmuramoyl-L-alanine--D-glutamate ligase [Virgibacillus siamensis]|uniref:UDP-N-acetylmuramoyl-L-alanine--D-glutamate ligase n=1 Tax=Virgibacillus siamensis TaxID=480071 RepID=UPI00098466A2|nr:UDP-N-acetylmuramoyl-L-alanine--D-glutamate ligase [Virgibacillus siamensis]